MTFSELKREILVRIARLTVTTDLQAVQAATTEPDLVTALKPIILFAIRNSVLDAALLAEFTEANLNAEGIYTTGSFTLTNPTDAYVLLAADVTVNMDAQNVSDVHHFGTVAIDVNCEDESFVTLHTYQSSVANLTAINNSLFASLLFEGSNQVVIMSNEVVGEIHANDNSVLDVTANDDAICVLRSFGFSDVTYLQNDSSYFDISRSDDSIVNTIPL